MESLSLSQKKKNYFENTYTNNSLNNSKIRAGTRPALLREIRDEAGNVKRYDRSQGVAEEGKGRPAFIWPDNIAC